MYSNATGCLWMSWQFRALASGTGRCIRVTWRLHQSHMWWAEQWVCVPISALPDPHPSLTFDTPSPPPHAPGPPLLRERGPDLSFQSGRSAWAVSVVWAVSVGGALSSGS